MADDDDDDDRGTMKRLPDSPQIDLSDWEFGEDGLGGLLMKGCAVRISEVLREVFHENPPTLTFPIMWSGVDSDGRKGGAVTDPAMLYLELPLGSHADEDCLYGVSLEKCVNELLGENLFEKESGQKIRGALAARLRELADKLEATP